MIADSIGAGRVRVRGSPAGFAMSLAGMLLLTVIGAGCSEPDATRVAEPTRSPTSKASTPTSPPPTRSSSPASAEPSTVKGPPPTVPTTVKETLPSFSAAVHRIGPELLARMSTSLHPGCPVGARDLRYLRMTHFGFTGSAVSGEMVVHASQARAVVDVFRHLYAARWPIRQMRLVDDYGGNDDLSLSANNSSGFNCRRVAGTQRWSDHAYGHAIDINPIQNPYVVGTSVAPEEGRRYVQVDRSADVPHLRGVIGADDVVVAAFERIGWEWGGDWINSKDYQHFSLTGG